MDIFDIKGIQPMLIFNQQMQFNHTDWIYELKLDGIRCIAYLNDKEKDLRNKRNLSLLPRFPELRDINHQVKMKCILDGEIISLNHKGVPDFYQLQRRTTLTDQFKIQHASLRQPASFVTYDILYCNDRDVICRPLMERKNMLSEEVK